ncbi:MAG TPA: isoprenyl transferase [Pyrinomonadaceae bacterium]|nr:isoprenyl transferase [Pyrinomonadaceae bacterium]
MKSDLFANFSVIILQQVLTDFTEVVETGSRDEALLASIDWERLPRHVAIIMDGNGRWAAQRGQPRIAGHRAGVEAVRAAVDTGARLGLRALTLYAFSTENWKRPRYEVDALMRMLRKYLRIELDEIDRQNIRFQTIGRTEALARNVREEIARASEQTAKNTGMVLSVALNYGGRAEIVDACRAAMRKLSAEGKSPDELTEDEIARELYTHDLAELDLLVRTSGELRISNFLLWQSAYAEIHVTETLWPDFRRVHLLEAVLDYQQRSRRFGGLKLVVNAK